MIYTRTASSAEQELSTMIKIFYFLIGRSTAEAIVNYCNFNSNTLPCVSVAVFACKMLSTDLPSLAKSSNRETSTIIYTIAKSIIPYNMDRFVSFLWNANSSIDKTEVKDNVVSELTPLIKAEVKTYSKKKYDKIVKDQTSMQKSIDTLREDTEKKYDKIIENQTSMQKSIDTLEEDVSTLKSDVSTLKSDMVEVKNNQASMQKSIDALEHTVSNMNDTLNTICTYLKITVSDKTTQTSVDVATQTCEADFAE